MASPTPIIPVPVRRRSLAGPVILIVIGVLALLRTSNLIDRATLHHWFAHYWPLLLIAWGIVRLVEYYSDQQSGFPARRTGGGGVALLILLVIFGLGFSAADKVDWNQVGENIQVDGDNP